MQHPFLPLLLGTSARGLLLAGALASCESIIEPDSVDARVVLTPAEAIIPWGEVRALSAVVFDRMERPNHGATVTWASLDSTVAQVDTLGNVTAVRGGSTRILARSEGAEGSADISVNALFTDVAVGTEHSCAVFSGGATACWGSDGHGQLGRGGGEATRLPVAIHGDPVFTSITGGSGYFDGHNAKQIWQRPGGHSCGLTSLGKAYCWGYAGDGQLGDGISANTYAVAYVPTPVAGDLIFRQLDAGDLFVCGVTADSRAYCWGSNREGQLGTNAAIGNCHHFFGTPQPCSAAPVAVEGGHFFTSISAGGDHACGLTDEGQVYCWGANDSGQLGATGSLARSVIPVRVPSGIGWKHVSAGRRHTCAVDDDGAAHCWGNNSLGQLGMGTSSVTPHDGPVLVLGGLTFAAVSAGHDYTCAITTAGEAHCWGSNAGGIDRFGISGRLGNGSYDGTNVPARVAGGLRFRRVEAGRSHTCGITLDAVAYCWGTGRVGQLGNGAVLDSTTPVAVAPPVTPPNQFSP